MEFVKHKFKKNESCKRAADYIDKEEVLDWVQQVKQKFWSLKKKNLVVIGTKSLQCVAS
jgi:hypothetical protein